MPLEPEGPFDLWTEGHILSAEAFIRWLDRTHGFWLNTGSYTRSANILVRRHPELYAVWRAQERILKGVIHAA